MMECALFNFVVWGLIGSCLCAFGYIGNLLSVFALRRDIRTPTTTLLQSLAVSDLVLLLSVCITDAVPYICAYTEKCYNLWKVWPSIRYIWILTPVSHMCSIWLVVLISGNRYWAVCRPHTTGRVWTNGRTGLYVLFVVCLVVAFNAPRLFEYNFEERCHSRVSFPSNDGRNTTLGVGGGRKMNETSSEESLTTSLFWGNEWRVTTEPTRRKGGGNFTMGRNKSKGGVNRSDGLRSLDVLGGVSDVGGKPRAVGGKRMNGTVSGGSRERARGRQKLGRNTTRDSDFNQSMPEKEQMEVTEDGLGRCDGELRVEEVKSEFGQNHSYRVIYKVILVNTLLVLLPIAFLLVSSIWIVRTLRLSHLLSSSKRRHSLPPPPSVQNNNTPRDKGYSRPTGATFSSVIGPARPISNGSILRKTGESTVPPDATLRAPGDSIIQSTGLTPLKIWTTERTGLTEPTATSMYYAEPSEVIASAGYTAQLSGLTAQSGCSHPTGITDTLDSPGQPASLTAIDSAVKISSTSPPSQATTAVLQGSVELSTLHRDGSRVSGQSSLLSNEGKSVVQQSQGEVQVPSGRSARRRLPQGCVVKDTKLVLYRSTRRSVSQANTSVASNSEDSVGPQPDCNASPSNPEGSFCVQREGTALPQFNSENRSSCRVGLECTTVATNNIIDQGSVPQVSVTLQTANKDIALKQQQDPVLRKDTLPQPETVLSSTSTADLRKKDLPQGSSQNPVAFRSFSTDLPLASSAPNNTDLSATRTSRSPTYPPVPTSYTAAPTVPSAPTVTTAATAPSSSTRRSAPLHVSILLPVPPTSPPAQAPQYPPSVPVYSKRTKPSREVTFLLVTVVMVAVVCQTPLAVFHFVRYAYVYHCGDVVFYLESFSKFLVNLNSCVNFVLYCLLSPRFRRMLSDALSCGGARKRFCRRGTGGGVGASVPLPPGVVGVAEGGEVNRRIQFEFSARESVAPSRKR